MVTTELVTIAVQHAAGAQPHVHYDGLVVAVEVRDSSSTPRQLSSLDPAAPAGRGLQIVDRPAAAGAACCIPTENPLGRHPHLMNRPVRTAQDAP